MSEERVLRLRKEDHDLLTDLCIKELDNKHIVYLPDWEELELSIPTNWMPRCKCIACDEIDETWPEQCQVCRFALWRDLR